MGRLVEVEWCSRPRLGWAGLGGGAGGQLTIFIALIFHIWPGSC